MLDTIQQFLQNNWFEIIALCSLYALAHSLDKISNQLSDISDQVSDISDSEY